MKNETNETGGIIPVSRRGILRGVMSGGVAALTARFSGSARAETPAPKQPVAVQTRGVLREYWIQVDAVLHNVVPNGFDDMMQVTYMADQTSFMALVYRAFTPKWGEPLKGNANIGPNTGFPGPIIRANVGDTIVVHFRNNDTYYKFPHSIHPHGVLYTPDSDGAWVGTNPTKPGTAIKPGDTYTYTYTALPSSVGTWPYHDHSVPQSIGLAAPDPELGMYLGMMGMIVVTDYTVTPTNVENIVILHDLYQANIPSLIQDFDCINGFSFHENTQVFKAKVGQTVRWRIAAFGREFHVFHLHGHRWLFNGRYDDAVVMGPATTLTFDYLEDNPGEWLYHCHVTDHMLGGMVGRYIVSG
jgi:FtsP/CotA-like multicopper oxidase with cupredoxin domain